VAATAVIRVAFVQAWLTIGGAERLVQALATHMDRTRVEPHLLNLYGPGAIGEQMTAQGWKLTTHLARSRFDLGVGGRLGPALEATGADVAYVIDSALPMFWMGLQRRRQRRPRLIVGFHSTGKLGDPVQHFLARRAAVPVADRLVALTEAHRRHLSGELHVPESRFEVLRSGVDLSRFDARRPREEARRAAGLPASLPLVGIVAALRPEKNHALFLAAAKRVAASVPEARFVIAGDGSERDEVARLAAASGLGERLLLLGAREDVPELYRALDVAVLSSHPIVETLPVTLLEAAACGTPGVATAVGSVADVLVEGETGFIVPVGDEAALAGRIVELLRDGARRERMGAAARQRAERYFDERDMIRRYEDLFIATAATAASR
jgi:glycosyltransferase involved in cell wall biosynthesis